MIKNLTVFTFFFNFFTSIVFSVQTYDVNSANEACGFFSGTLDIFKRKLPDFLESHNGDINYICGKDGRSFNQFVNGYTLLCTSCVSGNSEIVEELLRRQDIDVNKPTLENLDGGRVRGLTPLILAIRYINLECVKLLLNDHRTEVLKKDAVGYNALVHSIMTGLPVPTPMPVAIENERELVMYNQDKSQSYKQIMDIFFEKRIFNLDEEFYFEDAISYSSKAIYQKTMSLLELAICMKNTYAIDKLKKFGANINSINSTTGNTPLHTAVFNVINGEGRGGLHALKALCKRSFLDILFKKNELRLDIKNNENKTVFDILNEVDNNEDVVKIINNYNNQSYIRNRPTA